MNNNNITNKKITLNDAAKKNGYMYTIKRKKNRKKIEEISENNNLFVTQSDWLIYAESNSKAPLDIFMLCHFHLNEVKSACVSFNDELCCHKQGFCICVYGEELIYGL